MPAYNDCTKAAFQELEAVGIKGRLEDRGKHQALVWQHQGAERQLIIAISPSDWRAPMATRSEIRKMLKADGLLLDKEETKEMSWRERAEQKFDRMFKRFEKIEGLYDELINQKLKKLESDIEGILSEMVTAPPPVEIALPAPIVGPILAPPTALIIPMAPDRPGPKPKEFWDALEAQLAENTRLPPRKGYRIVPEHYEREGVASVSVTKERAEALTNPAGYFKNGKPKKGRKPRIRSFSDEGLEKIKQNAIRARAALAAKREALKGLA